jgi:hypothetical protein
MAFAEDNNREYASEPFQVQVAYILAFCIRFGIVKFWALPKELNGLVVCKYFEDV